MISGLVDTWRNFPLSRKICSEAVGKLWNDMMQILGHSDGDEIQ